MLIDLKTTTYGADASDRRRVLDEWSLVSIPANTPGERIWKLRGRVIQERDGKSPSNLRYTETSPIAQCVGNVVITASGSIYRLTDNPAQLAFFNNEEQYVADEFLNPWIEGNNWLTY